ncbi:MAG: hypothetical protein M1817_006865 [Caeruleum heppii]|nr:MAG: hypothetical protein M1817_006865 [Caeruleum heppii]
MTTAQPENYWNALVRIRVGYKNLIPGSPESLVDGIWQDILLYLFPVTSGFGVRNRTKSRGVEEPQSSLTLKLLHNDRDVPICLLENRGFDDETWDFRWKETIDQLVDHLTVIGPRESVGRLFGGVAVGRLVRFFTFIDETFADYQGTNGKALHVRDDQVQIQQILLNIRDELLRIPEDTGEVWKL